VTHHILAQLSIDREDASPMVTAGATANTTVKNSRASRESGLLCSHSHGESIAIHHPSIKFGVTFISVVILSWLPFFIIVALHLSRVVI